MAAKGGKALSAVALRAFVRAGAVAPSCKNFAMIHNLIDKVKLAFQKEKQLPNTLYGILGFYPRKLELYRIALSHKSRAYRGKAGKALNNERLEYLGDAILEAVVSDIVFHRYPNKPEGFLTCTRSKIVQRSSLNRLAGELGLDRLIQRNASPYSHNSYIGGNAFEALVGAIYLDRGYAHCKWFIEKRILGRLVDIDGVAHKEVNFKSKLLEWTQKNRILADYKMEEMKDEEANSPVFACNVVIEGITVSDGKGYSKKESQQNAARAALTRLRREPQLIDRIFRAKEKRTAMEADEVCSVPKIDEIEEEIGRTRASRHAKPAPTRPANDATPAPQRQQPSAAGRAPKTAPDNTARGKREQAQEKQTLSQEKQALSQEKQALFQEKQAKTQGRQSQGKPGPGKQEQQATAAAREPKPATGNGQQTPKALPRPEQQLALPRSTRPQTETPEGKTAAAPENRTKNRRNADTPADAEEGQKPQRPRRRPRNRNAAAGGQAAAQQDREAIIAQAEEAAWAEQPE